jgi:hypothetical protein
MSTYVVSAERSGKWWILQAVEAPGAISQVTRLDQAEEIVEAIAFVTGEPVEEIEIDLRPVLPIEFDLHLRRAALYRQASAEGNAWAAFELRAAAHELVAKGLSLRDVGTLLGVSYQRAHQLVHDEIQQPASHFDLLRATDEVA